MASKAKAEDQSPPPGPATPSRYTSQKQRDWTTFLHFLKIQKPRLQISSCKADNVIGFLQYLDQFGKTRVHVSTCPHYGTRDPPERCGCPLRQAWGSLDSLVGRLRAAYEEHGGLPTSNPFADREVRVYLHEVRDSHAKARGIPIESKKRKRQATQAKADAAKSNAAGKNQSSSGDASVLPPAAAPKTAKV